MIDYPNIMLTMISGWVFGATMLVVLIGVLIGRKHRDPYTMNVVNLGQTAEECGANIEKLRGKHES